MAYGLTASEAALVRHLVSEQLSVAEAAARIGITEATARVHLHRVFTKTDARRQADLVRLVLLGTPGYHADD